MTDAELEFRECPTCAAKPGSPDLCRECLERRALIAEVRRLREQVAKLEAFVRKHSALILSHHPPPELRELLDRYKPPKK